MKWYNLKNNKCPKCSSYLTGKENSTLLNCSDPQCDFRISTEKFTQLSNEYAQRYNNHDQFNTSDGWSKFGE